MKWLLSITAGLIIGVFVIWLKPPFEVTAMCVSVVCKLINRL